MKKNLDYNALKLDFFLSGDDLKTFIKNNIGKINWNITRKTAGWVKERDNYKQEILNKALEDNKTEVSKRLEAKLSKIDELYFKFIGMLGEELEREDLTITELYTIRKILRTEKGLQTNITKTDLNLDDYEIIPKWSIVKEEDFIND